MSFLNTLSGWQWLLLAAVPAAIVALYFLKLRRQPLTVPSTYLWTRAIEDLHVNSLWQRLRQSLLLLLQLVVVALAMLALLRPGWRGTQLVGSRFIFLIDTSASMSATDVPPTRLEAAKRRVLDLVDQMKSSDAAMVVSFSDVARVEQSFTDNRSLLRQKVNRIRPTNRRTDLREALRVAAGLANPGRTSQDARDIQVAEALPAALYIFSDGGFAPVSSFSLGNLTPIYVRLGTESPENLGILSFTAERNPEKPGRIQAFARVGNSGSQDVSVGVALYVDGQLVDASDVRVPKSGEAGVQFELSDLSEAVLKAELQGPDQLDLDNTAYAVLGTPRRARVLLVTPGNDALKIAATTDEAKRMAEVTIVPPEELNRSEHRDNAAAGEYDLVIYDRCLPQSMPQANTLFIGNVPPDAGWSRGELKPLPFIIDTDRAHPLTALVEMGGVKYIYDGFPVKGPEGSVNLFDSSVGPLLVIGQRGGFEDAALGFEILGKDNQGAIIPKTDWPHWRSFPVFVGNALRYLGGLRGSVAASGVQPGRPVTLRPRATVDRLEIETPSGAASEVRQEGQGGFVFAGTEELGVYAVREGTSQRVDQRFAVNLFDSRESNLAPRPEIQLGYETVTGRSGSQPARKELWKTLLLVGLGVLLFEWYVYNRRVYL